MVVYEVITDIHYEKVADFVNSQPKGSTWWQCFSGQRTWDVEHIKWIKEHRPMLHIFICEDEKGKIRAIEFCETRGEHPKEPKMLTNVLPFWDESDRKARNHKYVIEIMLAVGKHFLKQGYTRAEGIFTDTHIEVGLIKPLKGLSYEFSHDGGSIGQVYRFMCDIEKLVGESWLQ